MPVSALHYFFVFRYQFISVLHLNRKPYQNFGIKPINMMCVSCQGLCVCIIVLESLKLVGCVDLCEQDTPQIDLALMSICTRNSTTIRLKQWTMMETSSCTPYECEWWLYWLLCKSFAMFPPALNIVDTFSVHTAQSWEQRRRRQRQRQRPFSVRST